MQYRVEDKYIITDDRIAYLKFQLDALMQKDPNMKGDSYLIRSIYFDDLYNSCMHENEDGVNLRSKYRIRSYDKDMSYIVLERKSKNNGFTHKEQEEIDEATVRKYMELGGGAERNPAAVLGILQDVSAKKQAPGQMASIANAQTPEQLAVPTNTQEVKRDGQTAKDDKLTSNNSLITKLSTESELRLMSPVNIVEYERTAYIEPGGNVRITFDRNIGYTTDISKFDSENLEAIPILPKGQHILEVKYDEFLPIYIRRILNGMNLTRIPFSKYYYSRLAEREKF